MILTSPIVSLLCLYAAFVYGLLYLLLTTITNVFVLTYGWTLGIAGLSYIGLGTGFMIAVIIIGASSDRLVARRMKRSNNIFEPEMRLAPCIVFAFFIPMTFFWYGFSAEHDVHWAIPIVGLVPFGIGMIGVFLPITTYMIDAFPSYAASSTAALASSRNVIGTFLPLAGPQLCEIPFLSPTLLG